jgi:hypothetical protein
MTTHPAIVSIRRVLAPAFGPARELPPVWGASFSVLSFERRGPLACSRTSTRSS